MSAKFDIISCKKCGHSIITMDVEEINKKSKYELNTLVENLAWKYSGFFLKNKQEDKLYLPYREQNTNWIFHETSIKVCKISDEEFLVKEILT